MANDRSSNQALSLYADKDGDNTKQTVQAGRTLVYGWNIHNPNGSAAYVQLFNKLAADVTVGTTVNDYSILVPANGNAYADRNRPLEFDTGCVVACTTTEAGNTDPTTGLVVHVDYV